MSDLSRIVQVNITRQTKAVSQKGFGIGLILAEVAEKPAGMTSRTRTYLDLDGVAEDFAATTQTYLAAQAYFGQDIKPESVVIGFIEGTETAAEAVLAIKVENSAWYAVGMINDTEANQLSLAGAIEADCRIAGIRSPDTTTLATTETDIGFKLKDLSRERTFVIYSSSARDNDADSGSQYPEFAWLGKILPKLPGSVNWMFKTLSGISPDVLSGTDLVNLQDKNVNYFHEYGGQNITEEGTMASGEFIDIIRGSDFIQARMQEAIYARLVNLDKIPYTNPGVDIIVAEMEAVLQRAVIVNEILSADPAPTVTKPDVRDVSFNDRAGRILPDITFDGTFAGAVNNIKIRGNVTV